MKRCPHELCPTLIPNTARYCPTHTQAYETRRGTPTARGYGREHRARRNAITRRMARGETFTCHRCHHPIQPGQPWDLGHTDDRTTWLGPEHAACNRADGGRKGATTRNHLEY